MIYPEIISEHVLLTKNLGHITSSTQHWFIWQNLCLRHRRCRTSVFFHLTIVLVLRLTQYFSWIYKQELLSWLVPFWTSSESNLGKHSDLMLLNVLIYLYRIRVQLHSWKIPVTSNTNYTIHNMSSTYKNVIKLPLKYVSHI